MHLSELMPEINQGVAKELQEIREDYINKKFAFVPGERMIYLLRLLGATDDDFNKIQTVSENLAPDPTLPFRKSRNGRFCLDFSRDEIRRLKFQPFILSAEEDFVRFDSGMTRNFRGIQDELQLNTVFQALLRFKSFIIKGVHVKRRSNLNYASEQMVSTVFNLRTVTSKNLVGEPALEGVHTDGVDHTMTTYLGSQNMTKDSAVTFLHDMNEKNAIRYHEANPAYLLGQFQHLSLMDTLLILDNEIKHSLSPVSAFDKDRLATRDMLIFFTRHPVNQDHPTYPYDSFEDHKEIPMNLNMWS